MVYFGHILDLIQARATPSTFSYFAALEPPRIAAKFWNEYSGKQTLLSSFFGKSKEVQAPPPVAAPPVQTYQTSPEIEIIDNTPITSQKFATPTTPQPSQSQPSKKRKLEKTPSISNT